MALNDVRWLEMIPTRDAAAWRGIAVEPIRRTTDLARSTSLDPATSSLVTDTPITIVHVHSAVLRDPTGAPPPRRGVDVPHTIAPNHVHRCRATLAGTTDRAVAPCEVRDLSLASRDHHRKRRSRSCCRALVSGASARLRWQSSLAVLLSRACVWRICTVSDGGRWLDQAPTLTRAVPTVQRVFLESADMEHTPSLAAAYVRIEQTHALLKRPT